MDVLATLMEGSKIATFQHIKRAWHQRNIDTFRSSARLLSEQLTAALMDGVVVRAETLLERIGWQREVLNREYNEARQKLASQLADRIEQTTNKLIELHGLSGVTEKELSGVDRDHFHLPQTVNESIWGVLGSFAGGAMGGLIADLKLGGMTFGGGALIGGLTAGVGAYALIRSFNLVRGNDHRLRWSREHFREQMKLAMLAYLAVSHYGRGRGEWRESKQPEHWNATAEGVLNSHSEAIDLLWKNGVQKDTSPELLFRQSRHLMTDCLTMLLQRLYPELSGKVFS